MKLTFALLSLCELFGVLLLRLNLLLTTSHLFVQELL